jgi:hypothetical protein
MSLSGIVGKRGVSCKWTPNLRKEKPVYRCNVLSTDASVQVKQTIETRTEDGRRVPALISCNLRLQK